MSVKDWRPDDHHDEKFLAKVLDYINRQYGRIGHGLMGKDADLDAGGQLVLKSIKYRKINGKDYAVAHLYAYVSIVAPTDDGELPEEAFVELENVVQEIVATRDEYYGEWTGSDYWSFHHEFDVLIPWSSRWTDSGISSAAHTIFNKIMADQERKEFTRFAVKLNKDIEREVEAMHKRYP